MPTGHFGHDTQRITRSVGQGGVAGEFLIGDIGIVFETAGWFDQIDALACITDSQFRTPDRSIQRGGEIDPGKRRVGPEIGSVTDRDQISEGEVGAGAMIILPVKTAGAGDDGSDMVRRLRLMNGAILMGQFPPLAASPTMG